MIEVRDGRLGKSVLASQPIEKGEIILRGWGHRVPHRTQHSIQVDFDTHILIPSPIQMLNHSCDPNCGVLIRRETEELEIHALRDIQAGDELWIDYATFEWEIKFMTGRCLCGSSICRGSITGYKDMPRNRREAYGPFIAEYLVEMDAVVAKAG
jgi:hypothetical protein